MSNPLVSVVTPFHNTSAYLSQCIESVLAQSYSHFEYILVDNCSNDGSGEIAAAYAQRDPRIRLFRRSRLLSQVQNYNGALAEISDDSLYCKIVQADDSVFPQCLELMLRTFELSETIGLVSSFYLKGDTVRGPSLPYPTPMLNGKEMARLHLREGGYVFGSPTTVGYRSSIVRDQQPFYDESLLQEDTEKCMQILEKWDFGFVPQVLSFLRMDNESISASVRNFVPGELGWYIMVQRYASTFLGADEAKTLKERSKQTYYRMLSREALKFRGPEFWQYHRAGLKTLGESLSMSRLAMRVCRELLWLAVNPGLAARLLVRCGKRRIRGRAGSHGGRTGQSG